MKLHMNRREFTKLSCAAGLASVGSTALGAKPTKPNLLIIHTDEHNFRTLGCYRAQLSEDQACVWGKDVKVDTPHIDSLARDGALCTSHYAASPVCTPSRASLISGLYPIATGAPSNNLPLNDDLVSFAEILRRNGYATSYVGKWHLDGPAKPGWAPKRQFGFSDNRYMFNRGHWKMFEDTSDGPRVKARDGKDKPSYGIDVADKASFATDFLTDKVLEIIERDKDKPFCVLLSLPDPHGPNSVRAPYDTMYADLEFKNPRTMDADAATMPKWVNLGKGAVKSLNQTQMQQYFGMVRCIDDNVGRMLKDLESRGLAKNTIVVFTADHGDLMGEHKKHNKGLPYETSACVPFVIRFPGRIASGKVIRTAQTNADFAPTILAMMGFAGQLPDCHGGDVSADFVSPAKEVRDENRIVYFTNSGSQWVAAVSDRYKLVLSPKDRPWLFDLEKDPDELINFFDNPEYEAIAGKLMTELKAQLKRYGDPALERVELIYDSETPVPEGATKAKGAGGTDGKVLKPDAAGDDGLLIDAADIAKDATGGKRRSWSRALTVPPGSFAPNTTYQLIIDWESKGLTDGADFFANFICDGAGGRKKQLKTWTGKSGETGTMTTGLKTDASKKWTLAVGVRGKGHLVVKRIQIGRK